MSGGTLREWCRMFKDGRTNVCNEEQSGRPAVCSEWWSCSKCWPQNLLKRELHNFRSFMWISANFTYCSVRHYHRLGCHKFCARWVQKMFTGMHKTQRMALVLNFLERYHKDSDEFVSHIVWVTDDETWFSFMKVEAKEQSKQWMWTHIQQTSWKSLNKRCLPESWWQLFLG
jgi:hypothetical protein